MCPSLITPYYVYVSMSIYIYICITWLVEPPLKNLLAKLDHPVLKFPSLISVAMHIISPQQPPLQSSSSQAFCKRMCLIVRLRIRNHLKGKKNSRKMNCCKEAENVQGKGTWNYSGKQTSTDYQTQFGQVPCCYLSKGLLTLDLDLYFTRCFNTSSSKLLWINHTFSMYLRLVRVWTRCPMPQPSSVDWRFVSGVQLVKPCFPIHDSPFPWKDSHGNASVSNRTIQKKSCCHVKS